MGWAEHVAYLRDDTINTYNVLEKSKRKNSCKCEENIKSILTEIGCECESIRLN
jgi:hypothetical protein